LLDLLKAGIVGWETLVELLDGELFVHAYIIKKRLLVFKVYLPFKEIDKYIKMYHN
jgi:hypothetical protein